jgi:hypothetical protein
VTREEIVRPADFDDVSKSKAKQASFDVRITDSEGAETIRTVELPANRITKSDGSMLLPVVLDLDDDGFEFRTARSSDAVADFDVDGTDERSAWIGSDDALLILDRDSDGEVDLLGASEIAFAADHPEARTDMEGLALAFDTNANGELDRGDARWKDFGLWRDVDGDAETDAGELVSLDEAGIRSIGVVSDGRFEAHAGGDAIVFGSARFLRENGEHGTAADVALRFTGDAAGGGGPQRTSDHGAADEIAAMGVQRLVQAVAAQGHRGAMPEGIAVPTSPSAGDEAGTDGDPEALIMF